MKKIILPAFLLFGVAAFAQQPVFVNNPFPKTITVTGSAEMEVIPDEIYVHVELREYQKKGEAKTNIEKIKSDFLRLAQEIGIPDNAITIASYTGYNEYYHLRKKRRDPDMLASITYQVKFSSSNLMDAMVDKLDDEATRNFLIVGTSHSKITEFRKQLKIQAVKAAKEKGIYLTEAINEKLGKAITVIEPAEHQYPQPIMLRGNVNYKLESTEGLVKDVQQVDFKKIKLKYDVSVVFALE